MRRMLAGLFMLYAAATHATTNSIPVMLVQDETTATNMHLLWQTEPGVRYMLQSSTNLLSGWSPVPGYPAAASGLSEEHVFTPRSQGFFRIGELDEQPPRVVDQYPPADGFAVGRLANITVRLDDPSGIEPASIRLSVGTTGTLALGAPGLVFTNNTVSYDSGAVALGDWGETVTATLVVADTQGYALTNAWSFRLETEPQTSTNVFVFGSPEAQNVGQEVRGPATVLVARYHSGPVPQAITPDSTWNIELVDSNRVVLAYTDGAPPTFAADQLICNLVPTAENEIFYRRVISTSNDVASSRLVITTEDAALTDFVSQGGISVSDSSVILELNQEGHVVNAISVGRNLTFPRIGMNLSGTEFKLREDGFEVTVKGVTYSVGSDPDWLEVSLPESSWWYTPRVQAGVELDLGGLKSFGAIAQGDVATANVIEGSVVLAGVSVEVTLFDLQGPQTAIYMGQLGPIPVFATLGLKMGLKAEAEANTQVDFSATYRQDHSASFGLAYERAAGLEWMHVFQSTAPDLRGEAALTEELSFHLTLDPRVEFLVYALAGMKAALEPSVGVITTIPLIGGALDGKIEADADFVMGTAGPAFDLLGPEQELKLNIWHGEWPLVTQPQTLTFTTHPQSRTVAPGDAVSFSCTVDASATPSFQWFHKGLIVPGQVSRSLFLPYVNSGHAGNYFVRATAGGLTADSDPATLVVQTVTPENLDSDGDGVPDIYETNTGIWVSTTDRGTNPYRGDSDGDGLNDGVETRTGVYVSRSNTGTDPNKADSDGDGVNDKREIDLGTDPNSAPASGDYLIIDLSGGPSASSYPVTSRSSVPDGSWTDEYKTTKLVLRRIPAGTYTMGSPSGELGRDSNETQHQVTLTQDFYIGVFEVTQKQWERVMGNWPSYFNNVSYRDSRPVEAVSYNAIRGTGAGAGWPASGNVDADSFMGKLRARTGRAFDLPTEAQWEYAGRAGTTTALNSGYNLTSTSSDPRMDEVGRYWYNGGSGYTQSGNTSVGSAKVGSYQANQWGLYDIHGNVWEWCLDWYGTYPGSVSDPTGASSGSHRVNRGGSWGDAADRCRGGDRGSDFPGSAGDDMGFRACLPSGQQ